MMVEDSNSAAVRSVGKAVAAPATKAEDTPISFKTFLESIPPQVEKLISDLFYRTPQGAWKVADVGIDLHCDTPKCDGVRSWRISTSDIYPKEKFWSKGYLDYVCNNCGKTRKIFSLYVSGHAYAVEGHALKFGEYPPFGPPTPPRVLRLIQPDHELYLQGRRAENVGLGIGAYAYYRRVVENQKGRIIGQMIKAATRLGAKSDVITILEDAVGQNQFTAAVDSIKIGLPESLLIRGQNPLLLLHNALSEGIHENPDDRCLELAQDIRIVLTELAKRIAQATKDEAELDGAVGRLLRRSATKHNAQSGE
jgi:hypothetical protein